LAVQLLALAAHARDLSQAAIADRVSSVIHPDSVTQPTIGKWVREALPELATPTIALRRPEDVQLRMVCLLFRRKPALALKLIALLRNEPLVARVEQWRGEMNVFAEVIALDSRDIDDLVERYEPDSLYEVVERIDKTADALEHIARLAL
jgi:hypothetical protein